MDGDLFANQTSVFSGIKPFILNQVASGGAYSRRKTTFGGQIKNVAKEKSNLALNNLTKENKNSNYMALQETDYAFRIKTLALFDSES